MDPHKLPNNIALDDLKPWCSTNTEKTSKKLRVYKNEEKISTTKMKR
jgi:hypothetical protein